MILIRLITCGGVESQVTCTTVINAYSASFFFSSEEILNVFQHDADYEAAEEKYKAIRRELLDDSSGE